MEPAGQADLLTGAAGPPPPELEAGPGGPDFGIYVHALFCRTRCPYCDFNVAIYRPDRVPPLIGAIHAELARYAALPWAGRVPAGSLFLGGGTPSLLPPEAVALLVGEARRTLGLSPDAEVTLEANPDDAEPGRLRAFRAAGVTRLSLGVQSLDDGLLRRLGRTHDAASARRAYAAARAAGFPSVGVDVLYGGPDQSLALWEATLAELVGWAPDHLSAYLLTLEPGTAFGRHPPPHLPDDDAVVAQWEALLGAAARAGLDRYEVSNFARPGHQSRHNLRYWARGDYVGLGPGAHGAFGPLRVANLRSQRRYREAVASGWPIERWERLDPVTVRGERVVLGLRLARGVPLDLLEIHLAARPGGARRVLAPYLETGALEVRTGHVRFTERGVLLSDAVLADVL